MKNTLILILLLVIAGCSADIIKVDRDTPYPADNNKIAMEHFIAGSMYDLKEEFEKGALEYENALKYQKTGGIYYSLALDYYRLQRLAFAKGAISAAIKLDANNKEFVFLLASIYEAAKLNDSAAVCYEKILKTDSLDLRANYSLAGILKQNRPTKSLEIYNKLIKLTGPTPEVLFEIASINERLGDTKKTIKTIEDLIKLFPSDMYLKEALVENCIKSKEYTKALKIIDEMQILYPTDARLIEMKAAVNIGQGNWDKAKDEYLKIIRNPDVKYSSKIRIGIAFIMRAQTDSTAGKAARDIFEAVDKDTTDWQVKYYLAGIYEIEKADSLAIKYYKDAAKLADWNVDIWGRLGGLLFDKGRYEELKVEMEKALKVFPDNLAVNMFMGLANVQTANHAEAKKYLERVLLVNPNDVTALSALGYSMNQLKDEAGALKVLEKALKLDPRNMQVLSQMGIIYEARKDYKMSDDLYMRALAVDSTDILVLNNYAYSLSERGIDLDKALKMAKIVIAKEPKNSSYLDTIGWIYFKMGDADNALKYVEEAVKYGEKSSAIFDHLGDIYKYFKNSVKALEYWKRAQELDPKNEKIKLKLEQELK